MGEQEIRSCIWKLKEEIKMQTEQKKTYKDEYELLVSNYRIQTVHFGKACIGFEAMINERDYTISILEQKLNLTEKIEMGFQLETPEYLRHRHNQAVILERERKILDLYEQLSLMHLKERRMIQIKWEHKNEIRELKNKVNTLQNTVRVNASQKHEKISKLKGEKKVDKDLQKENAKSSFSPLRNLKSWFRKKILKQRPAAREKSKLLSPDTSQAPVNPEKPAKPRMDVFFESQETLEVLPLVFYDALETMQ